LKSNSLYRSIIDFINFSKCSKRVSAEKPDNTDTGLEISNPNSSYILSFSFSAVKPTICLKAKY
jgi:hypothetical protein